MKLVDANVLLYAVNEASVHHRPARRWLDATISGGETVGFSWIVVLAFLRLATHRAIFPRPLSVDAALATVRAWLEQPSAVVVEPTPRHVDLLAGILVESGSAGNLVNDAHLATLAVEHDAVLVSYDTGFSRFAGLRLERPT